MFSECILKTDINVSGYNSLNNNCCLLKNCLLCIPRSARSPFPRQCPWLTFFPFKHRLTCTSCTHINERNYVILTCSRDGRMGLWQGLRSSEGLSCCCYWVSSSSTGTWGNMRAPRPTRPASPISHPPWESHIWLSSQMWQLAQPPWRSRSKKTM